MKFRVRSPVYPVSVYTLVYTKSSDAHSLDCGSLLPLFQGELAPRTHSQMTPVASKLAQVKREQAPALQNRGATKNYALFFGVPAFPIRPIRVIRRHTRSSSKRIPAPVYWWHPAEGCNSIGNLIIHLCGNIGQWMTSVARGHANARDRHREFDDRPALTKAELLSLINETVQTALSTIEAMDPAKLTDPLVIQDFPVTRLTAIYETERHFSEHVGQIALVTKLKRGKSFRPLWLPETPPAQGV
ncbi:MAG: DUF1572 family protein [Candidatus Hydrogenedentes bacterium]|nr:DUF1572 family protein [Candidatus Hydrogenedentota bacterium]